MTVERLWKAVKYLLLGGKRNRRLLQLILKLEQLSVAITQKYEATSAQLTALMAVEAFQADLLEALTNIDTSASNDNEETADESAVGAEVAVAACLGQPSAEQHEQSSAVEDTRKRQQMHQAIARELHKLNAIAGQWAEIELQLGTPALDQALSSALEKAKVFTETLGRVVKIAQPAINTQDQESAATVICSPEKAAVSHKRLYKATSARSRMGGKKRKRSEPIPVSSRHATIVAPFAPNRNDQNHSGDKDGESSVMPKRTVNLRPFGLQGDSAAVLKEKVEQILTTARKQNSLDITDLDGKSPLAKRVFEELEQSFDVIETARDGNCFFSCVARLVHSDQSEWAQVRKEMSDFISKNRSWLQRYVRRVPGLFLGRDAVVDLQKQGITVGRHGKRSSRSVTLSQDLAAALVNGLQHRIEGQGVWANMDSIIIAQLKYQRRIYVHSAATNATSSKLSVDDLLRAALHPDRLREELPNFAESIHVWLEGNHFSILLPKGEYERLDEYARFKDTSLADFNRDGWNIAELPGGTLATAYLIHEFKLKSGNEEPASFQDLVEH